MADPRRFSLMPGPLQADWLSGGSGGALTSFDFDATRAKLLPPVPEPKTVFHDRLFLQKFCERIGFAPYWNKTAERIQEVFVNDESSLLWFNKLSNNFVQMAHFLGQCAKESKGFTTLAEDWFYSDLARIKEMFAEVRALPDAEAEAFRVRTRKEYEAEWDAFVAEQKKLLADKKLTDAEFAKATGAPARQAFLAAVPGKQRETGRKLFNKVYSDRGQGSLGNKGGDDGWNFRGRGLIHITGRYTYEKCGAALKQPLATKPELLEQPEYAVDSAAWYWCWGEKRIDQIIDEARDADGAYLDSALEEAMSRRVTKIVNSGEGEAGIKDRFRFTQIAFEMLAGLAPAGTK
jgi:predicted chitinase